MVSSTFFYKHLCTYYQFCREQTLFESSFLLTIIKYKETITLRRWGEEPGTGVGPSGAGRREKARERWSLALRLRRSTQTGNTPRGTLGILGNARRPHYFTRTYHMKEKLIPQSFNTTFAIDLRRCRDFLSREANGGKSEKGKVFS